MQSPDAPQARGPRAAAGARCWSTRCCTDETDLVHYGYRYYNPSTGRWPNRDPIGEKGGANLYGFVLNNAPDRVDLNGRESWIPIIDPRQGNPAATTSFSTQFLREAGIWNDLLNQWYAGDGTLFVLPDGELLFMMNEMAEAVTQIKDILKLQCRLVTSGRHPGKGNSVSHTINTVGPSTVFGAGWYLGARQRRLTGVLDCCSLRGQVCLQVSDRWDFDENDPWPSRGSTLEKIKYLGSVLTGTLLNFPKPFWSYVSVPVSGTICVDFQSTP